jgi:hypothetical protein
VDDLLQSSVDSLPHTLSAAVRGATDSIGAASSSVGSSVAGNGANAGLNTDASGEASSISSAELAGVTASSSRVTLPVVASQEGSGEISHELSLARAALEELHS